MPLIKQKSGLLDDEDYFLTGSFTDFLGGGICSRKDGKFTLKQGEIKRNFQYSEFAITVKNENVIGSNESNRRCFVETNLRKLGVIEAASEPIQWHRITLSDGFLQAYRSSDGAAWENAGGSNLEVGEKVLFMGFGINKSPSNLDVLEFSSCTSYTSPFVKLLNFPENFIAKLINANGDVLKTEPFGSDMIARLVLNDGVSGKFVICSPVGNIVHESNILNLTCGEEYLYTEYLLELRQGDMLLDYGPNTLNDAEIQLLNIKNAANETCDNLKLTTSGKDAAKVLYSLDGVEFKKECMIGQLQAGESKDFYIKIENQNGEAFVIYDFDIVASKDEEV